MPSDSVVELDAASSPTRACGASRWLDAAALRAVPKRRARKRRTVELDARGEIVWREEAEASS